MANTGQVSVAQRPTTPEELLRPVTPDCPVLLAGPEALWADSGILGWLETAGWSSAVATDPERASWLSSIQKQSLVLVGGSDAEVWSMVEAIRPTTMVPLVVLGAPKPDAVVTLLGNGVDAVVDPASGLDDVFARVVALLRRSDHGWGPGTRYLHAGALRVDLWSQECFLEDDALQLSPTEYALLTFLMTHPQQALSSSTIVRRVWGWFTADGKNALRIFVNRLRRKLHDDPRAPTYIASVRGTGYRFIRNVTELGDEAEAPASQTDVATLLQSVEDLAVGLHGCADVGTAAELFLDALDATGYADGMAVFRLDSKKMYLVGVPTHGPGVDDERRGWRPPQADVRQRAERAHPRTGAVRRHPGDGEALQQHRRPTGGCGVPGLPVPPRAARRRGVGAPRPRPSFGAALRPDRDVVRAGRLRGVRARPRRHSSDMHGPVTSTP